MVKDDSAMDAAGNGASASIVRNAVDAVSVFQIGWVRLSGLMGLAVLSTLFEGLGVGMILPVADLMQKGGEIGDLAREQGYWRYLAAAADWTGAPLTLGSLLISIFALLFLRNVLLYARSTALIKSVQMAIRDTRARGFELFLRSRNDFQDELSVGRLANDLTIQVQTGVGAIHSFVTLGQVAFMALFYLTLMLMLSWQLTLATLAITLAAGLCVQPLARRSRRVGDALVQANQNASAFLIERLGVSRLIRLARMERPEIEEMRAKSDRQAVGEVSLVRNSAGTGMIIETLIVACGMFLLYLGNSVLRLELATIGVTLAILLRQLPIAREFIIARQAMISNMPAAIRVMALFRDMKAAAEPESGARAQIKLEKGITLQGVVFRYPAAKDAALRGVNLTFPAGHMTALIGPSGGGKSTLIDLLPRLRDPQSGRILIDGTPITEFARSALRASIAYTPQSPQIFNCTVGEHIRYGKPDAGDDEITQAARLAGADEFIGKWPHGYATMLGERGVRLSGGQKQRIDLARALISGAEILILDEPTSNVDAETEHLFQQMLSRLRRETRRTIIVVGHRLSTIREADQIVVIMNGQVAESGVHDELIRRDGWYARAFRLQGQNLEANAAS